MSDINITDGFYHYSMTFTDVSFELDVELYLTAIDVSDAIEEAFEGDFLETSELETVKYIEITNYSDTICDGLLENE